MNWKRSAKNVIQELSCSSQVGAHCNVLVILCQFYNTYLTSQSCVTPITGCIVIVSTRTTPESYPLLCQHHSHPSSRTTPILYQDHTHIPLGQHPLLHQDLTTPSPGLHPIVYDHALYTHYYTENTLWDPTHYSAKTTPPALP